MGRVEGRSVDGGDDVAGLETGLLGWAAGDDRVLGDGGAAELALAALALPVRVLALAVRILALLVRVWPSRRQRWDPGAVVDGQVVGLLDRASIVLNRMPSHGRASGWPADAWAMSGRAMLIGMAKPIPWLPAGDRRC